MADKPELSTEMWKFGNEDIEVIFRKLSPIDVEETRPEFRPLPAAELKPETTTLEKGSIFLDKGIPLPCDIIWERDASVTMRDGTVIYTDIFRPVGNADVPAIISWSPYGKQIPQVAPMFVAEDAVSGLAKFEGPDPAYWCAHGYAVINPDARGAFFSEGDMYYWGTAEANDAYDLIEWAAIQEWCNGKVSMSGNSWLGIIQWFVAAQNPPHLAAIAPWEGHIDLYRSDVLRGGIPDIGFNDHVISGMRGNNRIEDMSAMAMKYPLMNGYWEDKSAKLEEITVPAYVVASYYNHHTIEGFRRISSGDKWLRVHNTMEWPDYYTPENLKDLRRFFDHYLKGIENGWGETPRVRLSVYDFGGKDHVNRPEKDWPLVGTQYRKLYLDGKTGMLSPDPFMKESHMQYRADDHKGQAVFTITFDKDTELSGYIKLRLWIEADSADDADLFVQILKLDKDGTTMTAPVTSLGYAGPDGRLRVSHRHLDPGRSTEWLPYHTHRTESLLSPGEIVPVEIPIRPTGMLWHKGQQLRVIIAGHTPRNLLAADMIPDFPKPITRNNGYHIIHTGGKFDSYLLIPEIP